VFADTGKPDHGTHIVGLETAVLTAGGVAFIESDGGCDVHFGSKDYADYVAIPVEDWACYDGAVAESRDDDVVVIAGPSDVLVVTPDGSTALGGRGSLVAWDDFAGAIYVAERGEDWVQALEPDGALRWEVDLGDPVRSLDDLGEMAAAAVMVATPDGGALRVLDGATGQLLVDEPTPSAGKLVGSRGGDTLGVAIPGEVHLFDIRAR
jgi:hypothetical protein